MPRITQRQPKHDPAPRAQVVDNAEQYALDEREEQVRAGELVVSDLRGRVVGGGGGHEGEVFGGGEV